MKITATRSEIYFELLPEEYVGGLRVRMGGEMLGTNIFSVYDTRPFVMDLVDPTPEEKNIVEILFSKRSGTTVLNQNKEPLDQLNYELAEEMMLSDVRPNNEERRVKFKLRNRTTSAYQAMEIKGISPSLTEISVDMETLKKVIVDLPESTSVQNEVRNLIESLLKKDEMNKGFEVDFNASMSDSGHEC